ncbi:hypothetical protein CCR94_12400 [Rhodoblastus sphagnicola]|uniref:Uncharacterized protein n=1 Tax=Rhodoblastus sphagnicola TaxID=333368 RepID=A0A2S6N7B0_9HYPH|nr:hypothetical protein [Rhodoblastus sphagnicola]MBB4198207.1 hypothetical protein [Rhodoblastus sphagnicola]PPQ30496.1 hypothetical protein CCR94_12400 [Rhodoblastus sphagnicola]
MRRLGEKPLSGAEKQKRHRERVKARLAEAVALKARAEAAPGEIPGLKTFYEGLLRELGGSADEAKQLSQAAASFEEDIVSNLRKRGQAALVALRRQRAKTGSSLLSRLAAMQEQG